MSNTEPRRNELFRLSSVDTQLCAISCADTGNPSDPLLGRNGSSVRCVFPLYRVKGSFALTREKERTENNICSYTSASPASLKPSFPKPISFSIFTCCTILPKMITELTWCRLNVFRIHLIRKSSCNCFYYRSVFALIQTLMEIFLIYVRLQVSCYGASQM